MNNTNAEGRQVFEVGSLENGLSAMQKLSHLDNPRVKVKQLLLPAGKIIPEHKTMGEITVHCLAGRINFTAMGENIELKPGKIIYLPAQALHAVEAIEDSSVLVTLLMPGE